MRIVISWNFSHFSCSHSNLVYTPYTNGIRRVYRWYIGSIPFLNALEIRLNLLAKLARHDAIFDFKALVKVRSILYAHPVTYLSNGQFSVL